MNQQKCSVDFVDFDLNKILTPCTSFQTFSPHRFLNLMKFQFFPPIYTHLFIFSSFFFPSQWNGKALHSKLNSEL